MKQLQVGNHFKHLLLLTDDKTAQYWMDNFYSYETNFIILTADDTWPKDPDVRKAAWDKVYNDEHKMLLVIGAHNLAKVRDVKKKIFLDPILLTDIRGEEYDLPNSDFFEEMKFNYTPKQFVGLIFCLFDQTMFGPEERSEEVVGHPEFKQGTWISKLVSKKDERWND